MEKHFLTRIDASVICIVLFILMLLTVGVGNKMRKKFWNVEDGDPKGGVNSLLGALFGLWAFMLAFTFNQSGIRYEAVRSMIVDEGNVLRNTILRADFFPDEDPQMPMTFGNSHSGQDVFWRKCANHLSSQPV